MKIEKIIYETTREVYSVEDKLSIAVIFLFCEKLGNKKLAELIYTDNHKRFLSDLIFEYKNYDVDLFVNFDNQNVKNSFYKTLEKVKKEVDSNGFLKALHEKDEFALVIDDILNYDFNKIEFKKFTNKVSQLKLEL